MSIINKELIAMLEKIKRSLSPAQQKEVAELLAIIKNSDEPTDNIRGKVLANQFITKFLAKYADSKNEDLLTKPISEFLSKTDALVPPTPTPNNRNKPSV